MGCQVWPAISAVSILELVTNSGSSRMSRAPNLHSLRTTKLFTSFNYNILHDLRTFRYCISVRTDTSEALVSSESSITDKTKEKKTPLKIAAEKKTCTWLCNAINLSKKKKQKKAKQIILLVL